MDEKNKFIDALTKLIIVGLGLIAIGITTSCSSLKLSTMHYDPIYGPEEVVLQVPSDVKIDTLSYSQLKWKLRTDNTFRWNFAQYAMDQPYNWYMNNFRYSYWRPFNSFDVYFNRYDFWYDWAFNYPYNWGFSSWYSPWRYDWYRPYRPWNHWNNWYNGPYSNPGYNVIWNSSRQNNNIAFINGRRGSRNFNFNGNSNIENTISTRYNKPRNNNSVIDNIVNDLRNNGNRVRVYDNPNNVPNNNVIRYNNNNRPIVPNNNSNNSRINHNWNNSNNNSSRIINSRPVYNNSSNSYSRGSSSGVSSGGSSRGSSGGVSSGGSSGGSSRGGIKND